MRRLAVLLCSSLVVTSANPRARPRFRSSDPERCKANLLQQLMWRVEKLQVDRFWKF